MEAFACYDEPLFINATKADTKNHQNHFFPKIHKTLCFDFDHSDAGRDIGYDVSQRMWPSLAIAVPVYFRPLNLRAIYSSAVHRTSAHIVFKYPSFTIWRWSPKTS